MKSYFFSGVGFFFFGKERNRKRSSDISFAVVPKSLKLLHTAPIPFYVLAFFWEDEDWDMNSLSLSNLLGLSAQSKAPEAGSLRLQTLYYIFYLHRSGLINYISDVVQMVITRMQNFTIRSKRNHLLHSREGAWHIACRTWTGCAYTKCGCVLVIHFPD